MSSPPHQGALAGWPAEPPPAPHPWLQQRCTCTRGRASCTSSVACSGSEPVGCQSVQVHEPRQQHTAAMRQRWRLWTCLVAGEDQALGARNAMQCTSAADSFHQATSAIKVLASRPGPCPPTQVTNCSPVQWQQLVHGLCRVCEQQPQHLRPAREQVVTFADAHGTSPYRQCAGPHLLGVAALLNTQGSWGQKRNCQCMAGHAYWPCRLGWQDQSCPVS